MLAHTPLRARAGAGGDRGSGGRGGGRPNRRDLTPDPHPPQNTPPPPPPAPKAEAATPAAAAEDDDDATPSATLASSKKGGGKKAAAAAAAAAQTVSSGVRLEGVSITFKNATLLKDVTWDCKKGDRVGLVGVNGAGKTTQLQLITGVLTPDAGVIARQSANMKIAHLTQEFDVVPTRTVREEFMSAYADETAVLDRTEAVQLALEAVGSDMDAMGPLLDELQELTAKAAALDVGTMDKKVDAMMPQLGFGPDDNDRLVASYSGGWQMRMCLGKLLLQDPDLILLDEPTNHLDLGAIEWLETRLQTVTVPMVIVSHDREFLDRLCTKIVETEAGVATTYKGNYSAYVAAKAERTAAGWVAFERWQKEVSRQKDMADRLAGGAQAGRAVAAQREVDRLLGADRVDKPFTAKKRDFGFPPAESLGQRVLTIDSLRHGYGGRLLFDDVNLEIEKGERVAIIGPNGASSWARKRRKPARWSWARTGSPQTISSKTRPMRSRRRRPRWKPWSALRPTPSCQTSKLCSGAWGSGAKRRTSGCLSCRAAKRRASPSPSLCSPPAPCSSWTSPRITWTFRARRRWKPRSTRSTARSSPSRTTATSSAASPPA